MSSFVASTPSVILDCGSHHLRAGYGGEMGPRLDVPTLVGHPRHRGVAMAAGMNESEVGEEALVKRGMLTVKMPIKDGLVQSWDEMEKLWSHVIFSELRVTPESHCFITTQNVNCPASQKEKTLELMMETFHVHSLFLGTSQAMSLYCYGMTTGVVLDSGKDASIAVPIHEGYALGRHVTRSPIAGQVLTDYLGSLLKEEGYSFGTAAELTVLNQAKEELCYVKPCAFNHSSDASRTTQLSAPNELTTNSEPPDSDDADREMFMLPDGQEIPLSAHRHVTTEVLFNFSLLGDERYEPLYKVRTEMGEVFEPSFHKGISWLPFAAINLCEPTLRPKLYANIVIAGNTLAFPGARSRVENEIIQLYRENHTSEAVTPIHVHDTMCRGYSAWLGGSILARTPMFPHLAISRQEYEEEGLRVVHYKSL
eukprot:gene4281-3097_t